MIDPRVNVDDLRVFLAVAETEHVTAAAGKLHLSQPAVTRTVGRLERQFGVALFDRPGQRVKLNAFGRLLVGHAQRIVADFDRARADVARLLDPGGGQVRLGFLASLGTWLVPNVIRSFRQLVPAVDLALRQGIADTVAELLADGEIDLLLTSPAPRLSGPMGWKHLGNEPLELVMPRQHRLATREHVHIAEFASDPFILLDRTTEFRAISDRLCQRAGFAPTVALETDQIATARALVGAGLGVAILPISHDSGNTDPATATIDDAGAIRPFGLAWISGRRLSGTAEALRTWLIEPDWDYRRT